MRIKSYLSCIAAAILVLASNSSVANGDSVELVTKMGNMQRYLHKAGLSLQAENSKLLHFYLHELEEVIEDLEELETYKNKPISALVDQLLVSPFEALEKSAEKSSFRESWQNYQTLIDGCNRCHEITGYEFIHIKFNESNPYMQSFDVIDP